MHLWWGGHRHRRWESYYHPVAFIAKEIVCDEKLEVGSIIINGDDYGNSAQILAVCMLTARGRPKFYKTVILALDFVLMSFQESQISDIIHDYTCVYPPVKLPNRVWKMLHLSHLHFMMLAIE
jgi:hypothetical protein